MIGSETSISLNLLNFLNMNKIVEIEISEAIYCESMARTHVVRKFVARIIRSSQKCQSFKCF